MSVIHSYITRFFRSRVWRLPATALGFALFGVGGIVLSLTVYPALFISHFFWPNAHRATRQIIGVVFCSFIHLLKGLRLLTFEVHNAKALRDPGQLIIANHPSLLDVVFLLGFTNASCVVKASLWKNPFTALAVRAAGYIKNNDPSIYAQCVSTLQSGDSLVIFPEGTRTTPGQPMDFHRGPSNVALSANIAITPVVIRCEPVTLLKYEPWYKINAHPPHYTLTVMPRIDAASYMANGQLQSKASRQLTRDLEAYFTEHTQPTCAAPALGNVNASDKLTQTR